jgi:transcription-repair coupling factor (superfamily II helicase)
VLYKRIASTENVEQLRALKVEMIDRFGMLPEQVKALFSLTELKQQAATLGLKKIDVHALGGRLVFGAQPNINTEALIKLIQTQAQVYKLDGMEKLKFTKKFADTEEKCEFVTQLLKQLTPKNI